MSPLFYIFRMVTAFIIICVVCAVQASPVTAEMLHVLQLNSYSPAFPTSQLVYDGAMSVFQGAEIDMDVEFLDSKRHPDAESMRRFFSLLEYRLSQRPPYAAVLSSDDNALRFALAHRDTLFKNIPIVFCGVNDVPYALSLNSDAQVTGVVEAVSMHRTVQLAMRLDKRVRRVLAVTDGTPSGQGDMRTFLVMQEQFGADTLGVLDLSLLTWRELEERLEALGPDTAVLLLSAYSDVRGVRTNFEQGMRRIVTASPVPVYHLWRHGVGKGLVGGVVISHYHQAREAALRIVDIVRNGKSSQTLPIQASSPNVPLFDSALVYQFDLDDTVLPPDTEFVNQVPSLFDRLSPMVDRLGMVAAGVLLIVTVWCGMRLRKARRMLLQYGSSRRTITPGAALSEEDSPVLTMAEALMNLLPGGQILVDSAGKIVCWNLQATHWTENSHNLVRGAFFHVIYETIPVTQTQLAAVAARMKRQHLTGIVLTLNDTEITADITLSPVHHAGFEHVLVVCTERGAAERTSRCLLDAERGAALPAAVTSGLSVMNGPLSALVQEAQNLQRRFDATSEINIQAAMDCGCSITALDEYCHRRGIDRSLEAVRTAGAGLATQMEELSGILRGTSHPAQPLHPYRLAESALERARLEYALTVPHAECPVAISIDNRGLLPPVVGDGYAVKQVFLAMFRWQMVLSSTDSEETDVVVGGRIQVRDGMLCLMLHNHSAAIGERIRELTGGMASRNMNRVARMGPEAALAYGLVILRHNGAIDVKPHPAGGVLLSAEIPIQSR